jgi:DNA-directed RNA polymerase subunit K/omega
MSDNEDNYSLSVGGSDDENDENEFIKQKIMKNNKKIATKPTISEYDDEDDYNDEIINEGSEDDNEEDYDENKINENLDDLDLDTEIEEDDNNDGDGDDDGDEDEDGDNDEDDEDDEDSEDLYGEKEQTQHGKIGGAKTDKNKKDKKQNTIKIDVENDIYEDDDDEYPDENYLQKFDKEMTKDYILDFHPECLSHNYDEIKALSKVTRDEFNIVIDPLHKTVPFLTKYERARILGQRTKQIECGAKPLVKVPENIIDSYIIAELELEQKAIPFIIRRPIPSGGSEYWNLKDLEVISF